MEACVKLGKKGDYTVKPPVGKQLPTQDLEDLSHLLREIKGVKRAVVRGQELFVRVNQSMPKVRERVVRAVKRFFRLHYHSPAAQQFRVRRPRRRPSPAYTKRAHRRQHIAMAAS